MGILSPGESGRVTRAALGQSVDEEGKSLATFARGAVIPFPSDFELLPGSSCGFSTQIGKTHIGDDLQTTLKESRRKKV